jgi:murein L,D-transpeptidase YcbB/YkuD
MGVRLMRTVTTALLLGILLSGCVQRSGGKEKKFDDARHAAAIQSILSIQPAWAGHDKLGGRLWTAERSFYQSRNDRPAWVDGDRTTRQLGALIDALRHADDHGLDQAKYGAAGFQASIDAAQAHEGRVDPAQVPELDARLTFAYLRYTADLLGWSANPAAIYDQWVVTPSSEELAARLATAIASQQVRETLEQLAPTHSQYKGLQAALARERQHPSGHLEQIRMNLERWRWMPRDLGGRYVLVNVPAYQMQVVDGGKTALAMRVIVGAPDNPTPLFNDEMTNVVFSPSWNIPEKIIRNEMVPHQVSDPSYLSRHEIEVVGTSGDDVDLESVDWTDDREVAGLRFRQAPGPQNSLGLVKFIFPNAFNVYLHDTPGRSAFNKQHRALSHGCVRVENPVGLAQYVLRDQPQWTIDRISDAMNAAQEQAIPLKTHLPVHIGYWTAWVNADGSVTYTDDPYRLDEKQAGVERM